MRRRAIALSLVAVPVAVAVPAASTAARSAQPDVRLAPITLEDGRGHRITKVHRGRRIYVVLRYTVVGAPAPRKLRLRVGMRFARANHGILVRTHAIRTESGKWRWRVPVTVPLRPRFPTGRYRGYVVVRLYAARKPVWIAATVRFPTLTVVP